MVIELWLTGTLSFVVGFVACLIFIAAVENDSDLKIEKSGVWVIKDRAYKLTRINPEPRDPR